MRKRYNHATTSTKLCRIRNSFFHATNITAGTRASPQALPNNDCMDFHEYDEINFDYQDDNSSSEFDNEDESKDESDDEEERDGEEGDEEEDDDYEDEEESDDNKSDDDDERDEEDDDDDDEGDQDPIIDAPMNRDQMSNINDTNERFAPYFENTTSALLFCWMQKHNICKLKNSILIVITIC
jgi:hypothetical protein